jgi:hypothetical protein
MTGGGLFDAFPPIAIELSRTICFDAANHILLLANSRNAPATPAKPRHEMAKLTYYAR